MAAAESREKTGSVVEKPSLQLDYQLIDSESQLEPALDEIRRSQATSPLLAVDCEGERLSRRGDLSIVSIATEDDIYLIDIKKLGADVFDKGLRSILEDSAREKLMYDCREDSDCLWHQYQVKLANVLDLQLMEVIHRKDNPEPDSKPPEKVERLRSFLFCLETYVKDEDLIKAKEAGREKMSEDGIWLVRPFKDVLLQYSACDVRGFLQLYRKLKGGFDDGGMKRLRVGSHTYLDFHRSRATRCYDDYETNSFLPMYVVPGKSPLHFSRTMPCVGCRRCFPRSDFSKNQLKKRIQKCPVCKEVKRRNDVQANREDNWARSYNDDYDEYYGSGSD